MLLVLEPTNLCEPPGADPHARCGAMEEKRKTPGHPISFSFKIF